VHSIKVENNPVNLVTFYYGLGVQHVKRSSEFSNILLLDDSDGSVKSLGEIADRLGIYF
jgi:hypothetical protein